PGPLTAPALVDRTRSNSGGANRRKEAAHARSRPTRLRGDQEKPHGVAGAAPAGGARPPPGDPADERLLQRDPDVRRRVDRRRRRRPPGAFRRAGRPGGVPGVPRAAVRGAVPADARPRPADGHPGAADPLVRAVRRGAGRRSSSWGGSRAASPPTCRRTTWTAG